jgi:STAS-like domain of unknown function (DUF4325)
VTTDILKVDLRLESSTECLRRADAQRILDEKFPADLAGRAVVVDLHEIGPTGSSFIDGLIVGLIKERGAGRVSFVGAHHRVAQYIAGAAQRRNLVEHVALI